MKKQKQLYRHQPESGIYGDCMRATIACLLELPIESVPHFLQESVDKFGREEKAFALQSEWLGAVGYKYVEFPISSPSVREALDWSYVYARGVYLLFTGMSKNLVDHVVIILNGDIVWDTAIDDSGVQGPGTDGYYRIGMLIGKEFTGHDGAGG